MTSPTNRFLILLPALPATPGITDLLEETLNVELVHATQSRNIPGRKSDVSDAVWLAELAAHGLLRASFVPPEEIRQLRDLTRLRTHLQRERTREYARLPKRSRGTLGPLLGKSLPRNALNSIAPSSSP